MNENEKSRSGLQTAVDFAHAARAAKRIMQAAAASGVHGAASATAREVFPLLLKVLIAVLVIFIAVPMVIFTALPNIFFGYNSSGTDILTIGREIDGKNDPSACDTLEIWYFTGRAGAS